MLGPLSVAVEGREVVISGVRRRDVLIRLALNEGRPLESSRLLESVWEGDVPVGAGNRIVGSPERRTSFLNASDSSCGCVGAPLGRAKTCSSGLSRSNSGSSS